MDGGSFSPARGRKERLLSAGTEQILRTHILEILADCQSFSV